MSFHMFFLSFSFSCFGYATYYPPTHHSRLPGGRSTGSGVAAGSFLGCYLAGLALLLSPVAPIQLLWLFQASIMPIIVVSKVSFSPFPILLLETCQGRRKTKHSRFLPKILSTTSGQPITFPSCFGRRVVFFSCF